jgi:microcystin-dependent protein
MTPYVGEIRMFAGTFAPVGWFLCDGSLQSISQYQVLYAVLGTTYGGDGVSTFALPDLRGRIPVGMGQGPGLSNYVIGQKSGSENVTLLTGNLPSHNHSLNASGTIGTAAAPGTGSVFAKCPATFIGYLSPTASGAVSRTLAPASVTNSTGGQPHPNMMPGIGLNFIISWQGIYPQQS